MKFSQVISFQKKKENFFFFLCKNSFSLVYSFIIWHISTWYFQNKRKHLESFRFFSHVFLLPSSSFIFVYANKNKRKKKHKSISFNRLLVLKLFFFYFFFPFGYFFFFFLPYNPFYRLHLNIVLERIEEKKRKKFMKSIKKKKLFQSL